MKRIHASIRYVYSKVIGGLVMVMLGSILGCPSPEEIAHRAAVAACGLSTSQTRGLDYSWSRCQRACYSHEVGDSFYAEFYCRDINYCDGTGTWGQCPTCAVLYLDTNDGRRYENLLFSCEF